MDPHLQILMVEAPMSVTPREAFEQADEQFQQAALLRRDADELQEQLAFMYERADVLTEIAEGLQGIGVQDREAMQATWDECLRVWKDELEVYTSDEEKAGHFEDMQSFVEDGMVNVDAINLFLYDVKDYCMEHARAQRSASPEPETPVEAELTPLARTLLRSDTFGNSTLKRNPFTVDEDYEAGADASARKRKRPRYNEDSVEDTLINHEIIGNDANAVPEYTQRSVGGTAEEISDGESQTLEDEGSEGHELESEVPNASDKGNSSTSTTSHTTNEACALASNCSPSSNEDLPDTGRSSAWKNSSISSLAAENANSMAVQKAKDTMMGNGRTAGNRERANSGGRQRRQTSKAPQRRAPHWRSSDYTPDERRMLWVHFGNTS